MKITFFGHANVQLSVELQQKMLQYLSELTDCAQCEFLLGGYGNFDAYALKLGLSLKKSNCNLKLTLVSPYMNWSYLKTCKDYIETVYDEVVYPEIEKVPKKFAISARNKWMVDSADVLVSYVDFSYGGAYNAYRYALMRGKNIINFGRLLLST